MSEESYTLQHTYQKLDALVVDLEKIAPNPTKYRLIDLNKEYTPQELRDLLQKFGSYLSSIHPIEARIEAECHAIKEGLKTGLSIAVARAEKEGTVKDREAHILSTNEALKKTRMLQIDNESSLIIVQGWRKAYEAAYTCVSRIVTLELGEMQHTDLRTP